MKKAYAPIFGSLQLATYVGIIAYAGVTYLSIGHWPSYGNPDPKQLPTPLNFLLPVVLLMILLSLLSVVIYPIAAAFEERKVRIYRKWHLWIYLTGLSLWLLDMNLFHFMNPQHEGLLSWIFD